jgi:hypothetical protein
MSDIEKGLPIRTENNGDAAVKIVDGTLTSQALTVNADGSLNITDNGGSITVDGTDLDIRDLDAAQDSVAISDGTDTLAINADGSLNATVTATNLDIRDLAFATDKVDVSGSTIGITATDLDIRDLAFATDSVTAHQGGSWTVTADQGTSPWVVSAADLDVRDLTHVSDSVKIGDGTDLLAVNADGSINVVVTDGTPGTPVNDYNTAAAVAGGSTSTHTYTSTGNFNLTQVEFASSGRGKIEVQVNGATKFVKFNTESDTSVSLTLSQPILATSGQTVTVIRTNRQNQAQDLYSTISGYTL